MNINTKTDRELPSLLFSRLNIINVRLLKSLHQINYLMNFDSKPSASKYSLNGTKFSAS